MFQRDKATSPVGTSERAENVFFPGSPATNQLLDRGIGAGGDSVSSTGLLHFDQCLQGFGSFMPGVGSAAQIVNNFLIKSAERC
jgi:hypothetical protein